MPFSLTTNDDSGPGGSLSGTALASSTLTAITTSQLVVGAVAWNRSSSQTVLSVKDNAGTPNTYNLLTQANASASTGIILFWLFGPLGSPTIITANMSASVPFGNVLTTVWSGGTASVIDQQINATGSSVAPTGGNITPTIANELVFAACAIDAGGAITVATPFTLIDGASDGFGSDARDIQTTAAMVAATFSAATGTWAVVEASFKLVGGSGIPLAAMNLSVMP